MVDLVCLAVMMMMVYEIISEFGCHFVMNSETSFTKFRKFEIILYKMVLTQREAPTNTVLRGKPSITASYGS